MLNRGGLPIEAHLTTIGVGAIFLIAAVLTAISRVRFLATAARTTGVVIAHRVKNTGKRRRRVLNYLPDVEFHVEGQRFVVESHVGDRSAIPVGSVLKVVYDPKNPASARLDTFRDVWFWTLFTAILGLVFTSTGGLLMAVDMMGP